MKEKMLFVLIFLQLEQNYILLFITGQTPHQQNKDASTAFIGAEGGGATRPCKCSK